MGYGEGSGASYIPSIGMDSQPAQSVSSFPLRQMQATFSCLIVQQKRKAREQGKEGGGF